MPGENGTDQGAGQGQSQGQSQGQPMHEAVINGEKVQVPLDKLIASYQQDAVHTQKFQALAKERQKFASERKQYDELVRQEAMKLYTQALQENQGDGHEPSEADIQAQKIAEMEKRFKQMEEMTKAKETDATLQKMLGELKGKFGKMDSDRVLWRFYKEAQDTDDVNELLAKIAQETHDAEVAKEKAIIDSYIKSKSVNPFAAGEHGHSSNPPHKPLEPVKSFAEARERAEKRLAGEI